MLAGSELLMPFMMLDHETRKESGDHGRGGDKKMV
jgi:hypothetical protein